MTSPAPQAGPKPALDGLMIADPPERWEALGFSLAESQAHVGGITINLGGPGSGIHSWTIRAAGTSASDIDGLPTLMAAEHRALPQASSHEPTAHPNGAIGIDHVVVVTPDFERTASALETAGMPLRRIRSVDAGAEGHASRQGFRRLGPAILELVEAPGAPDGPARFWGLVVVVRDLTVLAARLKDDLRPIKDAVQPGRRIATLHKSAGLGTNVAFMNPAPAALRS